MVQCKDTTYYTGSTKNLENRLKLHNSGKGAKYVRGKGPVQLVYSKKYRYFKASLNAERRIKSLSRKEKEVLIRLGRL